MEKKRTDKTDKDYHRAVADVSAGVVKFFKKTFSNVYYVGPDLDPAEIQRDSPVMFVSTHRSHCDYFLVGSYFCLKGFKNIRFAAGDNLTKLPWIGPKFLAFGAFTVSRDSALERNYVRNLCAKVMEMLCDGDSILVFPEGGRSYGGETLDIRGGILNAALLVQAASPNRNVYLLPAAVSYECPPDLPFFQLLLQGKKLRKKSNNFIKRFVGAVYYFGADIMAFAPFMVARYIFKRYGEAFMDYGAPVSIKSLVDLEANRIDGARDEFSAHRVSLDVVGERVYNMFVSLYRILPAHAISAILKTSEQHISLSNLEAKAADMKAKLVRDGMNCKTINDMTAKEIVTKGLTTLRKLKAVKVIKGKNSVVVGKPHIIDYYAATIVSRKEKGE